MQVSPINIIVAVALALSDPPQQSPIFGHRALSHTTVTCFVCGEIPVCRFNPRKSRFILAKFPPAGIGLLSQSGRRLEPGMEVGSAVLERKCDRVGPALRSSVKVVCGRREGVGGETVARQRIDEFWCIDRLYGGSEAACVCAISLWHFVNLRMVSGV